jgi:putative methionine-R-sulfoxide reductase with GAF domain
LLDQNREFAVLRAANSEGGKRMLARGHKLEISQTGIVGFVAATGQPRIALDVGSDPIHFDNPDLPETRSEAGLPLRYAERIIGALDVQSTEPNAFSEDDMEALLTLADQVSAAINITLVIQNTNKALAESQSALEKNIQDTWKVMRPKSMGMGFQLVNAQMSPLEKHLEGEHIQEAISKGSPTRSAKGDTSSNLAIPIRLRGQIIGVINLRARNQRKLTSDDADIARAVTERLSLAIESAILLQSTQHRADIERVTTNISSKISSSTHFETILQTAAQELSKALGGSDVLVQIEPISMDMEMPK